MVQEIEDQQKVMNVGFGFLYSVMSPKQAYTYFLGKHT